MSDQEKTEAMEELAAAPAPSFPSQLFTEEDGEDNQSFVRGYN